MQLVLLFSTKPVDKITFLEVSSPLISNFNTTVFVEEPLATPILLMLNKMRCPADEKTLPLADLQSALSYFHKIFV